MMTENHIPKLANKQPTQSVEKNNDDCKMQ